MSADQHQEKKDAIRVKVIQHNSVGAESSCCKFSVAPELTGYNVLQNLITKAFDIKGDIKICYLARDNRLPEACWLPLLSDFDLQLAFTRSSDPFLLIKVEISTLPSWNHFELSKLSLPELPKNNYSNKLPGLFKEKMKKTISVVQKAFNISDYVFNLPQSTTPLSDVDFQNLLNPLGILKDPKDLRLRIYSGGVESSLRKVVWKHLLNVYPENLTGKERMDYIKEKCQEYYEIKDIWQKHLQNMSQVSEEVKYTTNMVKKDVLRTDRHHTFFSGPDDNVNVTSLYNILTTYALNHPSVGYCQGMSDLASPLLYTMKDEPQAYICFCALMLRLKANFNIDGYAMTTKFQHLSEALMYYDYEFFSYLRSEQADDLLFCYRWLLLELKREFAFNDAQYMLEVLWSSLPPKPPLYTLDLFETRFNPVKLAPVITQRTNHYENICALRRQRSKVSRRETLLSILNMKAASIDCTSNDRKLNRTLSHPIDTTNVNLDNYFSTKDVLITSSESGNNSACSQKDGSSEDSSESDIKIKDLSQFKKLTSPKKENSTTKKVSETKESPKKENDVNNRFNNTPSYVEPSRRCFSESDTDFCLPASDDGDVDVWQNPIDIEEALVQPKKLESDNMSMSVSSCEDVLETSWQVPSPGSSLLPPPEEFGGGNPFLIFLCLSMLLQQKRYIMQNRLDHNELAIHFDRMVRRNDVNKVLIQARKMFESYCNSEFSSSSKKRIDASEPC